MFLTSFRANAKTLEYPRVLAKNVGDEGLEPSHDFVGKHADRVRGDAESDASSEGRDGDLLVFDDDAGWTAIKAAWPKLSADAQRAIVEFVDRELDVAVGVGNGSRDRGG